MSVYFPNGDNIEYLIDGQHRRIGKKVNGVIVKKWIYSGQLSPIAELDSADNVIARFVGSMMIKDGNTYKLITDHLSSVRIVVDVNTGDVSQKIDYDEFGNVLSNSNPDFQPFTYAGGLYDTQTRLVRYGARDYEATTGRWTCKDPIVFAGGSTLLYGYVENDPINMIDPTGEKRYIMVSGSVAAGVTEGPTVIGEGGNFYLYDIQTGKIEGFKYVGIGVGLSMGTPLLSVEAGIVDVNDLNSITGLGWSTTIGAANGLGISGQIPASYPIGYYGFGVGVSLGAGFGYGEEGTYTWRTGSYSKQSLPASLKAALDLTLKLMGKCQ